MYRKKCCGRRTGSLLTSHPSLRSCTSQTCLVIGPMERTELSCAQARTVKVCFIAVTFLLLEDHATFHWQRKLSTSQFLDFWASPGIIGCVWSKLVASTTGKEESTTGTARPKAPNPKARSLAFGVSGWKSGWGGVVGVSQFAVPSKTLERVPRRQV